MSVILEAKGIKKSFRRPAQVEVLKGVDLTVAGGDSVAIMGRSGEGKSTLLHILGTLENASSGGLTIGGKEVGSFNLPALRTAHLGFVFQSYHLLEDETALQNILMPAKIARSPTARGSDAWKRAHELLELVGLQKRGDFNVKLLSGGEKQRVAIARAFLNAPDLILADEPSGNLDSETAGVIHKLLLDFPKEGKRALILVTHDDNLANLCSRRYTLQNGLLMEKT